MSVYARDYAPLFMSFNPLNLTITLYRMGYGYPSTKKKQMPESHELSQSDAQLVTGKA